MRALVIDHSAEGHLAMSDVPGPAPDANQALIEVVGTSLNRGEVAFRAPAAQSGTVLGWDASGIVVQPARDHSGPAEGARVLTVDKGGGGWAELRAIDTSLMTVLPEDADLAGVAALPVAGLSALRALRSVEPISERRIMITGASGGVGRLAVQLAARDGAEVIAVASSEHHPHLLGLGAASVVARPSETDGSVHAVIDMVGGDFLTESYRCLEDPGGTLVSVGHASAKPEVFEVGDMQGRARTIRGFQLFADVTGLAADLGLLVRLMSEAEIDPGITWRKSWTEYGEAVDALLSRQLHGKAVLEVGL
jgi:NADPH:quinone reductase-like Zn-dependent oxidoreductase